MPDCPKPMEEWQPRLFSKRSEKAKPCSVLFSTEGKRGSRGRRRLFAWLMGQRPVLRERFYFGLTVALPHTAACVGFAGLAWRRLAGVRCSAHFIYFIGFQFFTYFSCPLYSQSFLSKVRKVVAILKAYIHTLSISPYQIQSYLFS